MKTRLSPEELRDVFKYDPDTGAVAWRVSPAPQVPAGGLCGWVTKDGYIDVEYRKVRYPAQRIAFALMVGRWPKTFMDHINHNRADNRWSNLREASKAENSRNRLGTVKRSGYKGVSFHKASGTYHARIKKDRRTQFLGRFADPRTAALAYNQAAIRLHGPFACLNVLGVPGEDTQ